MSLVDILMHPKERGPLIGLLAGRVAGVEGWVREEQRGHVGWKTKTKTKTKTKKPLALVLTVKLVQWAKRWTN